MAKDRGNRSIPEGLLKLVDKAVDLAPRLKKEEPPQFQVGVSINEKMRVVLLDFSEPVKFVGFFKNQAIEIGRDMIRYAESLPDEPAANEAPVDALKNAAPQVANAETMDRSAKDEARSPEREPKGTHFGEPAGAAPKEGEA